MSRGYAGVVNIANDVIVYGCVMEKHDKFLFAVLDRWSEVRLTIDGDKLFIAFDKAGHKKVVSGFVSRT